MDRDACSGKLFTQSWNRYDVSFATYLGAKYDASTINLTYHLPHPTSSELATPPLEIVLSFLSPITPTSTLRQSISASYLTVEVKGEFNIDLYIDLNGQWVSGDRASEIVWDLGQQELGNSGEGLKSWRFRKETEALLSEVRDQAEWGTLHFTGPSVGRSREQRWGLLIGYRMCAMRLVHQLYFDSALLVLEHCRTPLMIPIEESWKRSRSSPSPNHLC